MTAKTTETIENLERIARKHLDIETLRTCNSDHLDFHEISVWQLKESLEEAYRLGCADSAQ